ncbi:MAG: hypothetical protein D6772_16085 [Bacteroidetes bacterium]|nr:MAG: hypothetical protein D6772_16085 [Bacteroidota bacterium]
MSQNKIILTVLGFILAGIGFLAIFLNVVGVDFAFLYWLRRFGGLGALAAKVAIIMIGFIMIYFGQTDFEREDI